MKLKKIELEEETKRDHQELESLKDDPTKYFQASRRLQMKTPKKPLFIKDKNGNVPSTDKEKAEVIKEHFKSALAPEQMRAEIKEYPPTNPGIYRIIL